MAHFSLEMTTNSEKAQRKIKFKLVTESESQSIQFQESVNETISVNFNDNEYSSWDFENDEFDLSKVSFQIDDDQVMTARWLHKIIHQFESKSKFNDQQTVLADLQLPKSREIKMKPKRIRSGKLTRISNTKRSVYNDNTGGNNGSLTDKMNQIAMRSSEHDLEDFSHSTSIEKYRENTTKKIIEEFNKYNNITQQVNLPEIVWNIDKYVRRQLK